MLCPRCQRVCRAHFCDINRSDSQDWQLLDLNASLFGLVAVSGATASAALPPVSATGMSACLAGRESLRTTIGQGPRPLARTWRLRYGICGLLMIETVFRMLRGEAIRLFCLRSGHWRAAAQGRFSPLKEIGKMAAVKLLKLGSRPTGGRL